MKCGLHKYGRAMGSNPITSPRSHIQEQQKQAVKHENKNQKRRNKTKQKQLQTPVQALRTVQ